MIVQVYKNLHKSRAAQVCYNPYKVDQFTNIFTGKKVFKAKRALINHLGIFIKN